MATIRSRLATVARCAVVFVLAAVWSFPVRAATISPSDIQIEIATNLFWLDNSNDPTISVLDSQQNFFDRLVADSSPMLRITNSSTSASFLGGQLVLENAATSITDVQFLQAPGTTAWFWNGANNTATFQFLNPLLPGGTASMRFITGQADAGYTMDQNLFMPQENLFSTLPQYGVVNLFVQDSTSSGLVSFDPVTHMPTGVAFTQVSLDLSQVPVRNYDSGVSVYGAALTIQVVPEPGGLALAGAAAAAMGIWRGWGRRRGGKLVKV